MPPLLDAQPSPSRQPGAQADGYLGGPEWLARFAEFAAERHCVERACLMVSAVGRLVRRLRAVPASGPFGALPPARAVGRGTGPDSGRVFPS